MELRFDYSNPKVRKALEVTANVGISNGCPFCIGRQITHVSLGERIVILKGYNAGRVGTCINETGYHSGEFLIRFDDQEENYDTRITYNSDEFSIIPAPKLPSWLLPLSIDDNNCIETEIVNFLVDYIAIKSRNWRTALILPIAHRLWWRRLPVRPNEVWLLLEAHGAPTKIKNRFLVELEVALEALRYSNGRSPIKKKRMRPFEVGVYMSTNRRTIHNAIHRIVD